MTSLTFGKNDGAESYSFGGDIGGGETNCHAAVAQGKGRYTSAARSTNQKNKVDPELDCDDVADQTPGDEGDATRSKDDSAGGKMASGANSRDGAGSQTAKKPDDGSNEKGKAGVETKKDHAEAKKSGSSQQGWGIGPKIALVAGGAVVGSVVAVAAAPVVLGAAGFSASGVVAGSAAAAWQATIGNVAAGSLFASLQSAGAAGVGAATAAGGAGAGATAGLVAGKLRSWFGSKKENE